MVPEGKWKVHHAFFARAGFTAAARKLATEHGALLVDLEEIDQALSLRIQ